MRRLYDVAHNVELHCGTGKLRWKNTNDLLPS